MLNKRFKIAKCKTSLKLATSRIKLMRNKKLVQIAQMKKELAQLLESGQDRTARIRVEHVIREEKMVAAYDLIDIYCELIVARLPIIESQKTCPIDLKEAVTSVIFAAPRCSDIPELVDAKKHFTAKYGKEFVSAAIELRPECGVSRMLVEKLSAVAPNVQTKVKVLSDVAKEHNINWDPTSFEEKESKPPDDLLNGPTYFEKASTISVDSPKIQTSNAQNVQIHEGNPSGQFDYSQQNRRFTLDAQNITTANSHDMRPSGPGSGMMNTSQSFLRNNSNSSSGNENWNMEFKDATSAAQVAAESAERASIAARAAAQLSSQDKITRQFSTESYNSRQNPQVSSEYTGQHNFKDSYNSTSSFNDRKSKTQSQQTGPTEIDTSPKTTKKSNSLRSRNGSINENSVNHFETRETSSKKESRARFTNADNEDSYNSTFSFNDRKSKTQSQQTGPTEIDTSPKATKKSNSLRSRNGSINENSVNHFEMHETSSKKESRARFTNADNEGSSKYANIDYYDERDDSVFYQQKAGQRNAVDQENILRDTKYDGVDTDDETDSDDGPRFDTGLEYDERDAKSFFPSPERDSSPKKNTSNTTGRAGSLKSVDHSVKFDLSGPDSETETETRKSTFSESKKSISKSRIELNDLVEMGSSSYNEYDDIDFGKDLKFGTLTGGLRNKGGHKYLPYSKVKESPIQVDLTSKQSSFNSRANSLNDKKPSVSMSNSESDSDDYNETLGVQKTFKTKSQFAPPHKFFNNDETDSEEEVSPISKRTSTGKVHLGPGSSRRTKGPVEPMGKTVISNPSPSENITKSPPEPRPNPSRFKPEPSRTKPDTKISEPPPKTTKKIVESGKTEAPKTVDLSCETKVEANNVKKPSHVHPKLPDCDSLAARIQALSKMNHQ